MGTTGAPRVHRARIPFTLFVPVLIVIVIAAGASLVAALVYPIVGTLGYGVGKVSDRMDYIGNCRKNAANPQRSTEYADDGKTVLATLYLNFNREVVRLHQISDVAQQSVLAIEDARFYEHGALNFSSLVRAALADLLHHSIVQGGSTITQQLVKNAVLQDTSQTVERKFQEAAIANCLERKYTKDQILELYLNDVYFANGVYGIGTAADFYFHEPASKLTLAQGALLAGIVQYPGAYDPIAHPKAATTRRNLVLDRMAELGNASQQKVDKAKAGGLGLAPNVGAQQLREPPFIVRYVTGQILANQNGEFDAFGHTVKQRTATLYQGGLKIYTTLDPNWQRYAEDAANQPWAVSPANPGFSQKPDTAIVSIDNGTGAIRTLLSGRNYNKDHLRLATAPRQPGSSFKPYTLTAAFEQQVPAGAVFSSKSPFHTSLWNNACHCVSNAEGAGDQGYLDLWQATADSVNVVFAQLELSLKNQAADVVAAAHQVGITSPLTAVPSLTLGTEEVTPLEMASAYQTFANDGIHCEPFSVSRVVVAADGSTLYRHKPQCQQVIKPEIAHLITAMLEGVVQHGTGTSAALGRPVAGKTGTTQDYSNAWFVGYTPQVSTSVWVGFPFTTDSMSSYFGTSVFGGTVAAPIWHSYMTRVMSGLPVQGFPAPPPPETGSVPRVVGMRSNAAQQKLAAAFFTPKVVKVASVEPAGTVINQSPNAGATAPLGSLVTISVSSGKAPQVVIPDVEGHALDYAKTKLENLGLVVKVVEQTVTNPANDGKVLSQDPAAGEKVDKQTTITLTVGKLDTGGTG
jgi:penicillin-binding protein 1A